MSLKHPATAGGGNAYSNMRGGGEHIIKCDDDEDEELKLT